MHMLGNFGVNLGGPLASLLDMPLYESMGRAITIQGDSERRIDLCGRPFHFDTAFPAMTVDHAEMFRLKEIDDRGDIFGTSLLADMQPPAQPLRQPRQRCRNDFGEDVGALAAAKDQELDRSVGLRRSIAGAAKGELVDLARAAEVRDRWRAACAAYPPAAAFGSAAAQLIGRSARP